MPTINVRWADNTAQLRTNLKEGVNQIEATKASVERMVKALAGDNLVAAAHKWTAAIQEMGGVAKISAADQVRALGTVTKAIETLERQSRPVPVALREMAAELKSAQPQASALTKWFGSLSSQLVATAGGFISAQAIIGAFGTAFRTVTGFVADSVKAYAAAESAQVKLTAALRSQGMNTPVIVQQYNDLATEFQRTTVFSDDLITSMQGLLTEVGGVMPEKMRGALKASTDLAAGLGIDLETATMLVAKAAAGHTETLGRYGITVDAAALKTEGFDAVLTAINAQFGGQAAAQVDTYAGSVAQLANAWDNVMEAVGKMIVTDPVIKTLLGNVAALAKGADTESTGLGLTLLGVARELDRVNPGISLLVLHFERLALLRQAALHPPADVELPPMPAGRPQGPQVPAGFDEAQDRKRIAALKVITDALEKYQAVVREVTATQDSFAQTVDTIDGQIVEGIRYYLERGKTVQQLAVFYGLLETQVQAVSERMKIEDATLKASAATRKLIIKGFDDYIAAQKAMLEKSNAAIVKGLNAELAAREATQDIIAKQTLSATDFQAYQIDREFAKKKAKLLEDLGDTAQYHRVLEAMEVEHQARINAIDTTAEDERTHQMIDPLKKVPPAARDASDAVGDLAQAFSTLAQISGGSFGGAVKGIGELIGVINLGQTAMEKLSKAVEAGKVSWTTYAASAVSTFTAMYAAQQIITGYFEQQDLDHALGETAAMLGTNFGLTFNAALTAQVQKTADALQGQYLRMQAMAGKPLSLVGVDFTEGATAINLADIIKDAGGLTPGTLDTYTDAFKGLFHAIETGTITVAQGMKVLDENWRSFVEAGTDEFGFLSTKLREIIDLDREMGTQSKEIAAYLKGQREAGITAFNGIAAAAGSTKREVEDLGIIALSTFGAAIASGATFAEALKAAGPGLSSLQKAFDDLGISTDNAALKALLLQNTILQNNPTLIAGVSALGSSFAALSNMGALNVETFSAMQRVGMDMYTRIQGEVAKTGGSTKDALLPMQDYLHQAQEAAEALNIPLDQMTINMIKDSREAGIWQEKKKTAIELQTDAMTKLIDKLDQFINRLLGIPDVETTITTVHKDEYEGGSGLPDDDWTERHTPGPVIYGAGGGTARSVGFEPFSIDRLSGPRGIDTIPAWLAEGETVRTPSQEAALSTRTSAEPVSGGDTLVTVQVVLDGQVVGENQVRLAAMNKRGLGTKWKRALENA